MLDNAELLPEAAALYPDFIPDEQPQAIDSLNRYLDVVRRIYERSHGKKVDHTQEGE
jgi:hypothetical protein